MKFKGDVACETSPFFIKYRNTLTKQTKNDNISFVATCSAGVAELADAHDSKSCGAIHVGSSPTTGTRIYRNAVLQRFFRYMDLLK